jgi:hypothetical protein
MPIAGAASISARLPATPGAPVATSKINSGRAQGMIPTSEKTTLRHQPKAG